MFNKHPVYQKRYPKSLFSGIPFWITYSINEHHSLILLNNDFISIAIESITFLQEVTDLSFPQAEEVPLSQEE